MTGYSNYGTSGPTVSAKQPNFIRKNVIRKNGIMLPNGLNQSNDDNLNFEENGDEDEEVITLPPSVGGHNYTKRYTQKSKRFLR